MFRRQLPLALAVIFVAVLFGVRAAVTPLVAAPVNDPTTLYLTGRDLSQPVDHETWCGDCEGVDWTTGSPWTVNPGWVTGYTPPIINPPEDAGFGGIRYGCEYDSDDWFEYKAFGGVFTANTTLTATECRWRYASRYSYGGTVYYTKFTSSSPDLVITWTFDWGAGSVSYTLPPPVAVRGGWQYWACLGNPVATGIEIIAVPDSHDGHGGFEVVTVTITNPTGRKAGKSGGYFGDDWRGLGAHCNYQPWGQPPMIGPEGQPGITWL